MDSKSYVHCIFGNIWGLVLSYLLPTQPKAQKFEKTKGFTIFLQLGAFFKREQNIRPWKKKKKHVFCSVQNGGKNRGH